MVNIELKLIIIFSIFVNIFLLPRTVPAQRTFDDLLPLEKKNILNWSNKYCHEHHTLWSELVNDGYIKCDVPRLPVTKPPLFLTKLKGFQPYSISKSIFRDETKISIIFLSYMIYILLSKKYTKKKKILIITLIFIILSYVNFEYLFSFEDKDKIHPLLTAVKENYISDIKHHILKNKVDPNRIIKNGKSLLDLVAEKGFRETTDFVSSFAPEINESYNGKTKLITAIQTSNPKIVRKVLKYEESKKLYRTNTWPSMDPFELAALNGNFEIVKMLYDHYDYFVNSSIVQSSSVLRNALYSDNQETITFLLTRLNDLSISKKILIISDVGSIKSMDSYLKNISNEQLNDILVKDYLFQLLDAASGNSQSDMTKYLFEKKFFNSIPSNEINSFVKKKFKGYLRKKIFKREEFRILPYYGMRHALYLFMKNFDISSNIADPEYCNMICYAVKYNNENELLYLLNMGVDPNSTDIYGYSSIDYAKEHYNKNIQKIIQEHINKL